MVGCAVPGCKSSSSKNVNKVSFHQFPCDAVRKLEWLKNIKRQGDTKGSYYNPPQFATVCSLHFEPECYKQNLKFKCLKPDAVPTVFPSYPRHMQPKNSYGRNIRTAVDSDSASHPNQSDDATGSSNLFVRSPQECLDKHTSNTPVTAQNSIDINDLNLNVLLQPSESAADKHTSNTPVTSQNSININDLNLNVLLQPSESESAALLASKVASNSQYSSMDLKSPLIKCKVLETKLHNQASVLCKTRKKLKVMKMKYQNLLEKHSSLLKKTKDINMDEILNGDEKASLKNHFLKDQLMALNKKKPRWSESTLRVCIMWHNRSPAGYKYIRDLGFLTLPSLSTLKQYPGYRTAEPVFSSLEPDRNC